MEELDFDAYMRVFTSENTLEGIGLSLYIAVASTIPSVVLGTLAAWCIATLKQETVFGAIVAKLPQQIPHAVACIVMVNMFLPTGMLVRICMALGIQGAADVFNEVLYFPNSIGVIIEYIWKEGPYVTFMMLPSMSGMSSRFGEAACNLGASSLRSFVDVMLPNCMQGIRTCAIIVFVVTLGSYETPMLLGHSTVRALPVLAYSEYTFSNFAVHRPISMALNMVTIVIALVFSLAYYWYGVKQEQKMKGGF
ncbi:ABC transporter permease [Xiamenia xianingshaonis]|uniref:ABC transporter permease n=1 Tax=Xiamenia xianingshaonis TaxID=2682776 RepID=UPI00140B0FF0|nr:ABC transporter permease subunit [Xiamenia xianingshaonis]